MKTYGGSRCIVPSFLDVGSSWRSVVSFTPPLHHPGGEGDTRLDEPQGWSACQPLDRSADGHPLYWLNCYSSCSVFEAEVFTLNMGQPAVCFGTLVFLYLVWGVTSQRTGLFIVKFIACGCHSPCAIIIITVICYSDIHNCVCFKLIDARISQGIMPHPFMSN
jgi:hypothetical protein